MEINLDVIAGKWRQVRGILKQLRGRLNRDRSERITGQVEVQMGRLQERCGIVHAQAQRAGGRPGPQPRAWTMRRSA